MRVQQETINRLLRKQGRRGAKDVDEDEEDEDAAAEGGEEHEPPEPPAPAVPMFRWVSSARGITFSVPEAWLPAKEESVAAV